MDWKDFFYFNSSERNGITVLLVLIFLVLFSPVIYRSWIPRDEVDFSGFEKEILTFREQREQMQGQEEPLAKISSGPRAEGLALKPIRFNPNTLSLEQWNEMGVPLYVARSIGNYLGAGGVFRYKEDLERMYLVDESLYAALESFIDLPARPAAKQPMETGSGNLNESPVKAAAAPIARVVNLNQADTLELTKLRGIGPVFSRRIVQYRERLGGFHSLDQLLEVFGMDSLRLNPIRENIILGNVELTKIDINNASFEELLDHPYINYNVANSIIALRKQHGPFPSTIHIMQSVLIDDSLFVKLFPYLKVEDSKPAVQQ